MFVYFLTHQPHPIFKLNILTLFQDKNIFEL